MSAPLVLGYDDSPSANAALARTITLAQELGVEVVAVFGYYVSPLGGPGGPDFREALQKIGTDALARAVRELTAAGVTATSRLVEHRPADALLQVARETQSQLIIVGTEGENPISGAFLGSVVLKLVQRSSVPLLVVPTTAD